MMVVWCRASTEAYALGMNPSAAPGGERQVKRGVKAEVPGDGVQEGEDEEQIHEGDEGIPQVAKGTTSVCEVRANGLEYP
ncbi:hypothetical protein N9L68_02165 [bacterium]|nr:hypothetical protein [bacterium]